MAHVLGIDASTQSVTGIILDTEAGIIVGQASVNFGKDLPDYKAPYGFIPRGQNGEVHADPRMWLDALELCLERLAKESDLSRITAISGAGQQHGSVYLNSRWAETVTALQSSSSLSEQIAPCLSRQTAPIWMDTSTGAECREIAEAMGGDAEVCAISGSIAIERFTGPQIKRFAKLDPDAYARTARIHLVSSFMASVLAGADAPIDYGDGAGMNLLNLAKGDWDDRLLAATAPQLREKLPPARPGSTPVGPVAKWLVERFGLSPQAQVVAFTGDNPSSLVGMGASRPGKLVISLGTSDTLFAAMPEALTDPQGFGHVFGNPLGGFMTLQCFLNGSLAREKVRDQLGYSWEQFSESLAATAPGNEGRLMLPFFEPEISPRIDLEKPLLKGDDAFIRWEEPQAAVRACVEGQFLNMWVHSQWMELTPSEVFLTGGASQNDQIAQVVADVFGVNVRRLSVSNSVGIGAALRAAVAVQDASLKELEATFCAPDICPVVPNPASKEIYAPLREAFKALLAEAK